MMLLFVFAVALLVGTLLSELAHRTVLSTAVLFLLVGFVAGGATDVLTLDPADPLVLESGISRADEIFHLVALVIAASTLAHSSSDVLVARQFRRTAP